MHGQLHEKTSAHERAAPNGNEGMEGEAFLCVDEKNIVLQIINAQNIDLFALLPAIVVPKASTA